MPNPSKMESTNPPPIVLVHGFWDKATIFNKMARHLKKHGYEVHHSLNLTPNNGKIGIESLAGQLKTYIENHLGLDRKIILVGFSMGGLVSRYYLQRMGGMEHTKGLITIATPHHGTYVAYTFSRRGLVQMRPGSAFLKDLNSDMAVLGQIDITSIWAKYDTTIIPNISSRLPFGKEHVLPFGIHPLLPYSSEVIRLVEKAIKKS